MVTKRKGKQPQAAQEVKSPKKSHKPKLLERATALIIHNGQLVEGLIASEVWVEILSPLIDESIASVSGRKTNNRWYQGDFTRDLKSNAEFLRGYQSCAMELNNRILDFIKAKDDLEKKRAEQDIQSTAPIINPFLEEKDDWNEEIGS